MGPKQQSLQKNPVIFLQGLLLSELPELPELSELSAAIRAFCSNQPICYLSTRYVICLPHPDSRHITQTADYLRISKPPLIDILETWISRRLRYSEGLQRIRLKGFDFESRAFPAFSCDCSRIGHSYDDARFCGEKLASLQKVEQGQCPAAQNYDLKGRSA